MGVLAMNRHPGDKVGRVVLAIQRGGGDYLGDVGSIHQDFIDLLEMIPKELRDGWEDMPDPPEAEPPKAFFEKVRDWIRG